MAVQQDATSLFLSLTGFPADFRMVFDSDLAEEAGTDSERVQAMRKGAVFFYVFLVAFRFRFSFRFLWISLNSSWSGTGFVPMRDLPDSDDEDSKAE